MWESRGECCSEGQLHPRGKGERERLGVFPLYNPPIKSVTLGTRLVMLMDVPP